jgi:hypothetical protein
LRLADFFTATLGFGGGLGPSIAGSLITIDNSATVRTSAHRALTIARISVGVLTIGGPE